jgi:hypothetical protein
MITSTSGQQLFRGAQQVDAVHVGHANVGDDQIGSLLAQQG